MKNVFKCKQNFESKVRKTGHCSFHIHKENLKANQSAWSIYQGVTRGRRRILVLLLSIENMQEAWHCMNGGPPLRNDPVYDWFEKLDVWEIEIRVASGDNRTFITCIINLKSLKSSILYSFHHFFN